MHRITNTNMTTFTIIMILSVKHKSQTISINNIISIVGSCCFPVMMFLTFNHIVIVCVIIIVDLVVCMCIIVRIVIINIIGVFRMFSCDMHMHISYYIMFVFGIIMINITTNMNKLHNNIQHK